MNSPPVLQPSTPDPAMVTLVMGILRALIAALGGVGISVGAVDDQNLMTVAGVLVIVATSVWSVIQKYRAQRLDHEGSVVSAHSGAPVQPVARAI